MIGREPGLTFHTVDDDGVDVLGIGDAQLDVGRKCGPSQSDDPGILNRGDDLFLGWPFLHVQGVPSMTSWLEPG